MPLNCKRIAVLATLALLSVGAMAQDYADRWAKARAVTEEALKPIIEGRTIFPKWIGDKSDYFYYDVRCGDSTQYYIVDAKRGRLVELVPDVRSFVEQYERITGDKSLSAKRLRLSGIWFEDNDPRYFYWHRQGKHLVYDREKGLLSEGQREKPKSEVAQRGESKTSPSGYTMLVKDYNLYLAKDGVETKLTHDGVEGASYSRGFWVGDRYLCLLQDDRDVPEMGLINSLAMPRPTLKTFKMPMPVDKAYKKYKLFYYDAPRQIAKYIDLGEEHDQLITLDRPSVGSNLVYLTRRDKAAHRLELCRVDMERAELKSVVLEAVEPHINVQLSGYRKMEGGKKILWWSERSGYGKYYLYDSEGRLLRQLTKGDKLVASSIVHVDSLRKQIIFSAYGEEGANPYYRQYYKVGFDGKGQTLLTDKNYHHEVSVSPHGDYLIDEYSRMDSPRAWQVIPVDKPKRAFAFEAMPREELLAKGWQAPKHISLTADDGKTPLYGLMYLPSDLDSTKRYPIITHVYPGPQSDQIPPDFTLDNEGNQSLAELGFVVVQIAPRGSSPLRGRDFYCYGYGRLRDYPLADIKHSVEVLAERYSFIDLERVGIYGHSGGGFATVASLLTYPDFYKVGIAASGNHDNNIYIDWWANIYQGTGAIPTNMELADKLKAKLLLMTGDMDKNVPMSSTLRLADAFIKAGKRFDLFVFPGKGHGLESPYYYNLIKTYFLEHLMEPRREDINIIKS